MDDGGGRTGRPGGGAGHTPGTTVSYPPRLLVISPTLEGQTSNNGWLERWAGLAWREEEEEEWSFGVGARVQ